MSDGKLKAIDVARERIRRSLLYGPVRPLWRCVSLLRWGLAGRPAPPPALYKALTVKAYAKRRGLRVLIETGTFRGDLIQATSRTFDRVYSIELDDALYSAAVKRFGSSPHVHLLHGDSGRVLPKILAELEEPAVFWLDAHFSGGPTAQAGVDTPILEELRHVLSHPIPGHVVLVDDARCFGNDPAYPTIREIMTLARQLWPECTLEVADDIIRIVPK